MTQQLTEQFYTIAQFETLSQFGERYDLIEGRLVERTVPGGAHSKISRIIVSQYEAFDPDETLGTLLTEVNVRLAPGNAPMPDISFWKASREVEIVRGAMPKPDLAVEILSPSDYASKSALASAMIKVWKLIDAGVPVVWVINPDRKVVDIYRPESGYSPVATLGPEAELSDENIIPGFKLPLNLILRDFGKGKS